jgi:hypothetical protein
MCPPVVDYGPELQEKAAVELENLPEGSAMVGLLSDYGVMREPSRACIAG